jgi:hypothetical protein
MSFTYLIVMGRIAIRSSCGVRLAAFGQLGQIAPQRLLHELG